MANASSTKLDDWMRQGLSLHQTGRPAEAERLYRRVLDKQPSHPAANHLLGLIRLQQGHAESAVALISRAVHVRGGDPQYHCNLGVALNAAGQPERAIASFDRAIALQPGFAEAFSNRGMALRAIGDLDAAAESYRRAIALKPAEAGFHLNLANLLGQLGDFHAAEAVYREALRLRPGYPAALSGLCLTLEDLDRADEAIAAGEQATAARPDVAEYHRSLGRAFWGAGRPAEAVASYRRALALDPRDAESFRLMSLALRRDARDDEMAAMERLLREPGLDDEQQAHLHFALGKSYADLREYGPSFDHYVRGNRLHRRSVPFSLELAEAEFAALERLFEPGAALPAGVPVEAAPIFIVGLPRSGKSSLEAMLGRHGLTHRGGELPLLGHQVGALKERYGLHDPRTTLTSVPASAFAEIGANYMDAVRKLASPPLRVIDTMPQNFRHIGFLRLALPNARILHCTRDPLAHCVAMFEKYFARQGLGFASDLGELATYYRHYRRLMAHWNRVFPGAILEVEGEALRRDPEPQMRRILQFCGLGWDPACAALHETEPETGGAPAPDADDRANHLRRYEAAFLALSGE